MLFRALPALRVVRAVRLLRALRVLPAALVVGSSYRAIGTARTLLSGRLAFLAVTTVAIIFGGGQLLFLVEPGADGGGQRLSEALWWSSNLLVSGNYLFWPRRFPVEPSPCC